MKNRRKNGQFRGKYELLSNVVSVTLGAIFLALPISLHIRSTYAIEESPLISPEGKAIQVEVSSTSTPTPEPSPIPVQDKYVPTKEEVESYVKQVFRGNSKLAYAVAMVEGYPKGDSDDWGRVFCWYRWDEEKKEHKGEYSVGVFQINIIEGCNGEGDKVHYDRIPGDNLEEKVEWLSNPFNNILFARMLTLEQDGFHAWTGYTSGNYLAHMD